MLKVIEKSNGNLKLEIARTHTPKDTIEKFDLYKREEYDRYYKLLKALKESNTRYLTFQMTGDPTTECIMVVKY